MKYGSLSAGAILLLLGVAAWTAGVQRRVLQPIEFNHNVHIHDAGLECAYCHENSERLARAGIPNIAKCGECHTDTAGVTPLQARVADHVLRGEPIPWRRVNSVPQHVYFSHQRHVKAGRLECARCHGPMQDLKAPLPRPYVPLEMSWCIECHQSRSISTDCLTCHK